MVKGILIGTDDGLLEIVPGEEPRRSLDGFPITSLDYRDGISIASVAERGVWVQLSERWRNLTHVGDPGWQKVWDGTSRCVRIAPGDDLYIGAEPAALFSGFPGSTRANELGALRGAVQADRRLRNEINGDDPSVVAITFPDRGPEDGMFVGVSGAGVWHASDTGNGLTFDRFDRRSQGLDTNLYGLWIHPERSDRLFASTASGLFRSQDSGRTWIQSIAGLDRSYACDGVVLPGNPDVLLLSCARRNDYQEGALFRSIDDGLSWVRVSFGTQHEWEHAPLITRLWDSSDTVFVFAGGKLWASHDSAVTWVMLVDDLPPARALAAAL